MPASSPVNLHTAWVFVELSPRKSSKQSLASALSSPSHFCIEVARNFRCSASTFPASNVPRSSDLKLRKLFPVAVRKLQPQQNNSSLMPPPPIARVPPCSRNSSYRIFLPPADCQRATPRACSWPFRNSLPPCANIAPSNRTKVPNLRLS